MPLQVVWLTLAVIGAAALVKLKADKAKKLEYNDILETTTELKAEDKKSERREGKKHYANADSVRS